MICVRHLQSGDVIENQKAFVCNIRTVLVLHFSEKVFHLPHVHEADQRLAIRYETFEAFRDSRIHLDSNEFQTLFDCSGL